MGDINENSRKSLYTTRVFFAERGNLSVWETGTNTCLLHITGFTRSRHASRGCDSHSFFILLRIPLSLYSACFCSPAASALYFTHLLLPCFSIAVTFAWPSAGYHLRRHGKSFGNACQGLAQYSKELIVTV